MRTTLELDDDLVRALQALHPDLPALVAIEVAVRAYLRDSATQRLRQVAGSIDVDDVSSEFRRLDRQA